MAVNAAPTQRHRSLATQSRPPFQSPFWSRSVGPGEGSSLHVRVHDRTAVTLSKDLYFNFALFAFLFAACFPRLWKAWRGRNRPDFGELTEP
jgi:hypothetical protein